MMQPALFVANYIIEYSNEKGYPINNLRLQKILYFANARSLVDTGKPLFNEAMEKWKYGPVVPAVYHEYKQYGAFDIDVEDIKRYLIQFDSTKNPFDDGTELNILEYTKKNFSVAEKKLINDVIIKLSGYGTFSLVDETHEHSIWKEFEKRILAGEQGIEYSTDEIKDFFDNNQGAQIWLEQSQ